ncbi:MAG TPA: chemotaxis protein CheC [Clostridiaceae bacterium]|nr:chemotaxis protein CheC [Clostridiaceae bacterium]
MVFKANGLSDKYIDVLREIGNIGSGHAVTALSEMLNKKVNMNVPKIIILQFKELSEIMNGAESLVVGILLKISGDIKGDIMFILDAVAAKLLINMLMGNNPTEKEENENFSEIEISALKEIGNIMTGSYITALSMLTGLKIIPSVPYIAIDMAGAIISVPAIEFGKIGDSVLYIETEFFEGTNKVTGEFFLILETESFDKLMSTLGVNTY